jgi:hypothetical protein
VLLKSMRRPAWRDVGEPHSVLLQRLLEQERVALFLLCGVLTVLVAAEGVSVLLSGPRLIAAWVLALLAVFGYALYHLSKLRSAVVELDCRIADEHRLHAQLVGLAVPGARFFTDVRCGRHSIDLVILSQQGAYACDVKIVSAPPHASLKIALDAERFRVDGVTVTPNPARECVEPVQSLQQTLRIGRTDDIVVRPLIVVAGAAVEVERHKGAPDVPVIAATELEQFIKAQPEELSITELTMHAVRLAAHIRASSGKGMPD